MQGLDLTTSQDACYAPGYTQVALQLPSVYPFGHPSGMYYMSKVPLYSVQFETFNKIKGDSSNNKSYYSHYHFRLQVGVCLIKWFSVPPLKIFTNQMAKEAYLSLLTPLNILIFCMGRHFCHIQLFAVQSKHKFTMSSAVFRSYALIQ